MKNKHCKNVKYTKVLNTITKVLNTIQKFGVSTIEFFFLKEVSLRLIENTVKIVILRFIIAAFHLNAFKIVIYSCYCKAELFAAIILVVNVNMLIWFSTNICIITSVIKQ